ncbi:hypothetical protein ACLOJK_038887 [Asimina triloba]
MKPEAAGISPIRVADLHPITTAPFDPSASHLRHGLAAGILPQSASSIVPPKPKSRQRSPAIIFYQRRRLHHGPPAETHQAGMATKKTGRRSTDPAVQKSKQQKPICSLPPLLSSSDPAGQMTNLKIRCAHPIDPISATTATHQQHHYSSIWVDLLTMDEPSYKEIPFRNQHRGQRLQYHDPEQAAARAKSSRPPIIKQGPTTPANAPAAPNFSHSPAPDRPPGQTAIKNPQTASPMARANFSEYPH